MAHLTLEVDRDGMIVEAVPCAACNTPLQGERASGLCPGCGDPVAHSLLGRAVARLDGSGQVAEPVMCDTCGYVLQGVAPDGACPECHAPVGASLEGNLLRYADRGWLKKVRDGLMLYVVGIGVAILMSVSSMVIGMAIPDPAIKVVAGIAAMLVMGGFLVPAIWFVTAPDPDIDLSLQRRGGANLARVLVIPQFVLAVPGAYLSGIASTPTAQINAALIQLPLSVIGMLVTIGTLLHFKELARRVVDEKLVSWSWTILWLYVASTALAIIGGALLLVVGATAGNAGGGAMVVTGFGALLACAGGLVSLVTLVWMIILIFRLRSYFARAAKMAEA